MKKVQLYFISLLLVSQITHHSTTALLQDIIWSEDECENYLLGATEYHFGHVGRPQWSSDELWRCYERDRWHFESCSPVHLEHGSVTMRGSNRIAQFYCDSGYTLRGRNIIYCLEGNWAMPFPTCEPKTTTEEPVSTMQHSPSTIDFDASLNSKEIVDAETSSTSTSVLTTTEITPDPTTDKKLEKSSSTYFPATTNSDSISTPESAHLPQSTQMEENLPTSTSSPNTVSFVSSVISNGSSFPITSTISGSSDVLSTMSSISSTLHTIHKASSLSIEKTKYTTDSSVKTVNHGAILSSKSTSVAVTTPITELPGSDATNPSPSKSIKEITTKIILPDTSDILISENLGTTSSPVNLNLEAESISNRTTPAMTILSANSMSMSIIIPVATVIVLSFMGGLILCMKRKMENKKKSKLSYKSEMRYLISSEVLPHSYVSTLDSILIK